MAKAKQNQGSTSAKEGDKKSDSKKDNKTKNTKKTKSSGPKERFFRSKISGLRIPKKKSGQEKSIEGTSADRYERFRPYEVFQESTGDRFKIGLLKTTNKHVADVCSRNSSVQEIDKKEFEELMDNKNVQPARTRGSNFDNPQE